MESWTFTEDTWKRFWGRECPAECPHEELRAFCRERNYTDCWGAVMRFIFSEEEGLA
jgi:hypothetical protein